MQGHRPLEGTTCLVVGGGGFLGAHLCPKLIDAGASVRAFGRSRYYDQPLRGTKWVSGNLNELDKLAGLLDGVDVVFHLAGTSSPASAEAGRTNDLMQNVQGSLTILDMCRHAGVNRVVFASSGGTVYGAAERPPFTETTLPKPISSYGINKLGAEHFHLLYNHLYGMENVVLRIANPYGPFQHGLKNQGAVAIFIRRALAGQEIRIWGDGNTRRDYLFAGDVANAMIAVAKYKGPHTTFNVGSGVGRSLLELISTLEKALDRKISVSHLPPRIFDVRESVLDCSLARKELNWQCESDWDESVALTCDWIKSDAS